MRTNWTWAAGAAAAALTFCGTVCAAPRDNAKAKDAGKEAAGALDRILKILEAHDRRLSALEAKKTVTPPAPVARAKETRPEAGKPKATPPVTRKEEDTKRGIGDIVSGWVNQGLRGRELAARVDALVAGRGTGKGADERPKGDGGKKKKKIKEKGDD